MAVTIKLLLDPKALDRGLKETRSKFSQTADSIQARSSKLKSSLLVTGAALAGLGFATKKVIDAAAQLETVTTQYEVMTGSIETAKDLLEELLEFSAGTPFQFGDIAEAGRILMAFGVEAKNVTGRLRQLGDVAAVTGVPLKNLSQIFGKARLEGKLTAERLNQLQDRGINVGPAIADAFRLMGRESELTGVSLKKLAERGKITFDVFDLAFQSLSQEGGPAFEGMIKRSRTLEGLISTLGDNIQLLFIRLGNNYLPQIKLAVIETTKFVAAIKNNDVIVDAATRVAKLGVTMLSLRAAYQLVTIAGLKLAGVIVVVSDKTIALVESAGRLSQGIIALGINSYKAASQGIAALSKGLIALVFNFKATLAKGVAALVVFPLQAVASMKTLAATTFTAANAMGVFRIALTGLLAAGGIAGLIYVLAQLRPLWQAFWIDSFSTAKVMVASIAELAKGLGNVLLGAFNAIRGKGTAQITEGWNQIKSATKKGIEDVVAITKKTDIQEAQKEQAAQNQRLIQGIIDQERQIREVLGDRLTQEEEARLKDRYAKLSATELNEIKTLGKQRLVLVNENQAELDKFQGDLNKEREKNLKEIYRGQYLAAKAAGDQFNAQDLLDLKARTQNLTNEQVRIEAEKAAKIQEAVRLHRESAAIDAQTHTEEEIEAIRDRVKRVAEAENLTRAEQEEMKAVLRSQIEEEKKLAAEEKLEADIEGIYSRYEQLTNAEIDAANKKQRKINKEKDKANDEEEKGEKKKGKKIKTIRTIIGDDLYNSQAALLSSYSQLQKSEDKNLIEIAKAAALAQNAIRTADMVLAAYWGAHNLFAWAGPAVAIPAGIAATIPVLAFAAEQAGIIKATKAQEGGLVGRIPGTPATGDHQPFLLEPGEVVLPKQDVVLVREASKKTLGDDEDDFFREESEMSTHVTIGFEDEAASVIQTKQIENQAIGVGVYQNA